jgi:hypothetical protein
MTEHINQGTSSGPPGTPVTPNVGINGHGNGNSTKQEPVVLLDCIKCKRQVRVYNTPLFSLDSEGDMLSGYTKPICKPLGELPWAWEYSPNWPKKRCGQRTVRPLLFASVFWVYLHVYFLNLELEQSRERPPQSSALGVPMGYRPRSKPVPLQPRNQSLRKRRKVGVCLSMLMSSGADNLCVDV